MYTVNEFNQRLQQEFDGRLRCRHVVAKDEYHIEYKVARSIAPGLTKIQSEEDDAIRARDGYGHIMIVRKGDRMPCPRCGLTIKVPCMVFGEAKCEYCIVKGHDGKWAAGYWPLGDALIQYLRRLDPLNTWNDDLLKLQDIKNQKIIESKYNDVMNGVEAGTLEDYRKLVGIPTVHYGGVKRFE